MKQMTSPVTTRCLWLEALISACFLLVVAPQRGSATVIYWDPNGTTSVGGSGTWNTSSAQWSPNSTQVASGSLIAWNTADAAGFCAGPSSGVNQGAFTVSVNSAITMAGLFNGNLNPG